MRNSNVRELPASRAGSASRRIARERQRDFVKRTWRPLLALVVLGLVLTPLVALIAPAALDGLIVGAWIASVLWFVGIVVVLFTGSGAQLMGGVAERWTADELRRLRSSGWQSHHSVRLLQRGDIDHLAVGPAGVVVLETKWRSGDWDPTDPDSWATQKGERQLVEGMRRVNLWLKRHAGSAMTHAILVAWGTDSFDITTLPSGIVIVPGADLREYLSGLAAGELDEDRRAAVHAEIERQIARRQTADDERGERITPALSDSLMHLAGKALAALAGAFAAGWAVVAIATWPALALLFAAAMAGLWVARGWALVRSFAVGFTAGLVVTVGWVTLVLLGAS